MGSSMAPRAGFWDRHAAGYAKRPVADAAAYEEKLAVARGYLKPDMEVLEFGCGTGSTAIALAPNARHIHATDISGKMLDIAHAKAEAARIENVSFEQSSLEALQAPDGRYDAVLGHSILHLLEDKEAAVAKVYRMLKPGGVFITSTVCLTGGMALLRFVLPIGRFFGLLPLVRFFSGDDLEATFTAAGFRIEHRWQPEKGKAVFMVARKP